MLPAIICIQTFSDSTWPVPITETGYLIVAIQTIVPIWMQVPLFPGRDGKFLLPMRKHRVLDSGLRKCLEQARPSSFGVKILASNGNADSGLKSNVHRNRRL
jgi:hypothetical protein